MPAPTGKEAGPSEGRPSGEAPLPARLEFTTEPEAAAKSTITLAAGGTLTATAADGSKFELVVPAGAVAGDTTFKMTPLRDVRGVTSSSGPVHAVQLEPDGLSLFRAARLTITPSIPIPVSEQLMFESAGDGSDAIPALVDVAAKPIVLLVTHFSDDGVARATARQKAAFLEKSASNAQKRILGAIHAKVQAERVRELTEGDGPDVDLTALFDEYNREVTAKRMAAAASNCAAVRSAADTVVAFERNYQLMGTKLRGVTKEEEAASQARIRDALSVLQARYDECEKKAIKECRAAKDEKILLAFWISMQRQADVARAKQICKPGFQFEFSGTANGTYAGMEVQVTYAYWGLRCNGETVWKIWEDYTSEGGYSYTGSTGPPLGPGAPMLVTIDGSGNASSYVFPGIPLPGMTLGGSTVRITPVDEPTEVAAIIPAGATRVPVSAPVVAADGSIGKCEPPAP